MFFRLIRGKDQKMEISSHILPLSSTAIFNTFYSSARGRKASSILNFDYPSWIIRTSDVIELSQFSMEKIDDKKIYQGDEKISEVVVTTEENFEEVGISKQKILEKRLFFFLNLPFSFLFLILMSTQILPYLSS